MGIKNKLAKWLFDYDVVEQLNQIKGLYVEAIKNEDKILESIKKLESINNELSTACTKYKNRLYASQNTIDRIFNVMQDNLDSDQYANIMTKLVSNSSKENAYYAKHHRYDRSNAGDSFDTGCVSSSVSCVASSLDYKDGTTTTTS
jgi:predicted transcriptional regulator